jgi:arylsulfatase
MVTGITQKPIEGVSIAYTFDKKNANAPSTRKTQYFEMFANRGIYHDGWYACTTPPVPPWLMGTAGLPKDVVNGYKWELYNLKKDYSQYNDLAAKMPDKLRDMKELFLMEATKYNVFPLDNSILTRIITPRPSATAGRTVFTYSGAMAGLPASDAPSILNRSYTITAKVKVPLDGKGMIVTLGGRFGGYGFYLLKGKPVFVYNFLDLERFRWQGTEALAEGKHTLVFDFKYNGPGFGKGGTGVLKVDGKVVARKKVPHTIPFIMASMDETFDVGSDQRTPVDDKDYQVPFRFTGKIIKLTFKLGREQLSKADRKEMHKHLVRAKD